MAEIVGVQTESATKEESKPRSKKQKVFFFFIYSIIAFITFVIVVLAKLPMNRITDAGLANLSKESGLRWTAEDSSINLLLGLKANLKNVKIEPASGNVSRKVKNRNPLIPYIQRPIKLSSVSVQPNILKSLPISGISNIAPSAKIETKAFGGQISLDASYGKNYWDFDIQSSAIRLEKVPNLADSVALKGKLNNLDANMQAYNQKLRSINGKIELDAIIKSIDIAKLLPPGIEIPRLKVGRVKLLAPIENGKIVLSECKIGGPQDDFSLTITGFFQLKDRIDNSHMNLVYRFKPSKKLSEALPIINTLFSSAKNTEGVYVLKQAGTIGNPGLPTALRKK